MSECITLGDVDLPVSLEWPNRVTDWRIGQDVQTSVTGALVIQEAARQAGRPITLATGNSGKSWWGAVRWSTVVALQALVDAGGTYTLSIPTAVEDDPQVFTVRFDHAGPAIEARAIPHIVPPVADDWWAITLKFIVVE